MTADASPTRSLVPSAKDAIQNHGPGLTKSLSGSAVKPKPKPKPKAKGKAVTTTQSATRLLHLARRLAIVVCAVSYVFQSLNACVTAIGLLRGRDNAPVMTVMGDFPLIARLAGNRSIRESPLIHHSVLGGRTDLVDGTLYLHSNGDTSFTKCANLVGRQRDIYDNVFLRSLAAAQISDLSYEIKALGAVELMMPVVDCTTSDITNGDTTTARFFFLARVRQNTENVLLLVLSMSNQQYVIPAEGTKGPAGVATIQYIFDMRESKVPTYYAVSRGYPYETTNFRVYEFLHITSDGQWALQSIPAADDELRVTITTANRDGFYIKAESEQSNINTAVWVLETAPHDAIALWRGMIKPVLRDSWAWVHAVQFFIGMGLLSNLAILCLATYRNFQAGKWWIGDAFVSISTAQLVNGVAVLVSWFMNEYWVLHEFCFDIAYKLSGATSIYVYEAPMRVDLFTLYLSACGLIGLLFKERIDPLLATACFHLGFDLRLMILDAFPGIRDRIIAYADYSYLRGVIASPPGQEMISPMQLWAAHALGRRNYTFVAQCLFPVFSTLVLVVLYVGIRKLYRHWRPDPTKKTPVRVGTSTDQAATATTKKGVLTLFEIATGAELENRYGLVSDYETCLFIKGMKFASADGIYSTGFVIANKKFLLQTSDFWSIVIMKILRRRYKNVYVYDVNGSTVQQTARLVYPQTLTFQDLAHINISVLS